MEILALIATIIGGIVAAIQLFKWVQKLKISSETQIEKRPFVDIQVTYHGGESIPRGISPKAKRNPNQEYFIADETLHVFQLTRKIRVNLVNNSDQAAFYPKLFVHKNSPVPDFKNLNSIIPIKPHASIVVEGDYTVWVEAIPTERVRREESLIKEFVDKLELLLEYQDANRKTWFTVYKNIDSLSKYSIERPNGF